MTAGVRPGLDIDVKGTRDSNGKPKTEGAESLDHAVEIAHLIAEPTLLGESGGGIHAWYLFDEPWLFSSDAERESAQTLAHRWHEAHRQKSGVKLDATQDLARLLRVPGTLNGKGSA